MAWCLVTHRDKFTFTLPWMDDRPISKLLPTHNTKKRPGLKLTAHLHLVPKLRMCGIIPPLLQYVFMAWC
jgi:hypothetical protein